MNQLKTKNYEDSVLRSEHGANGQSYEAALY